MNRYKDRGTVGWVGWLAFAAAVEIVVLRQEKQDLTASHALRNLFWVEKTLGKVMFVTSYVALGAWLLPHILKIPQKIVEVVIGENSVAEEL